MRYFPDLLQRLSIPSNSSVSSFFLQIIVMADTSLKKKVDRIIANKLHTNEDFLKVADYIAPIVNGDIDMHTERRLHRTLEDRRLELNRKYLSDFTKINGQVQGFATKVRQMNRICTDLTDRIQTNKEKTRDLLAKTSALQNEKKMLESKQKYITEFLEKYSLSEEEEKALKGSTSDGTVTSDFFRVLKRVKEIHEDSKELLKNTGEHAAALEIMEDMSNKLEAAYEVLYRSIQRQCRVLNVEFLELKPVIYQSFETLQDREVLFKYALQEYCTARRNHIVRAYIDALTKGTSGGGKPIEQSSHDILRYIGDMLAWIHQSLAVERELMATLLKTCRPNVISQHSIEVQNEICEALCRPFKIRVEQALGKESHAVLLYRLSCLFTFYKDMMVSALTENSALVQTLEELRELTTNMFFSGLNTAVQRLLTRMTPPDYDLLPVNVVNQVLLLLRDVLESHDEAVAAVTEKKENFIKIFTHVLDPLNQSIQIAASNLHNPLDVAVYMLNCLSAINTVIILYQYTDARLEMLKAQMDANEDVLVSEQATYILTETGLVDIYHKAANHQPNQGPMAEISGMEPERIKASLTLFESFLAKPTSYRVDQCLKISSVRIRDSVQKRTFESVAEAYGLILAKLQDPANKYPDLPIKAIDDIKKILDI
ncbi:hypothetical protein QR680_015445 [Steinernema hermaphroditum]|uniref:Conserved oligomeric Golgi complex subunit 6 n=1 Tax=Steinernema hermaphroditum TaxID=289476 RepID=A0AA39LKU5_9BILA|nr:hypothetical protein QR680_015445 [Steinernema hermaphroditum]